MRQKQHPCIPRKVALGVRFRPSTSKRSCAHTLDSTHTQPEQFFRENSKKHIIFECQQFIGLWRSLCSGVENSKKRMNLLDSDILLGGANRKDVNNVCSGLELCSKCVQWGPTQNSLAKFSQQWLEKQTFTLRRKRVVHPHFFLLSLKPVFCAKQCRCWRERCAQGFRGEHNNFSRSKPPVFFNKQGLLGFFRDKGMKIRFYPMKIFGNLSFKKYF